MKIPASDVREGMTIPGLDNGYVAEVEENDGYLTYPGNTTYNVAMPSDTVLITYHDADGEECYLLLPGDSMLDVTE